MKNSFNKDLLAYLPELTSITPTISYEKRYSTRFPNQVNMFLKAGIFAINNDRKRSLLAVPKTPTRFSQVLKENSPCVQTPDPKPDKIHSSRVMTLTEKPISQVIHSSKSSRSTRFKVLSSSRYRKNPNVENLKLALIEIEKNPPQRPDVIPKAEEDLRAAEIKSDIEKLIESQRSNYINTNRVLKTVRKEAKAELIKEDDNQSQRSDPSPVRERKVTENVGRSQSSCKNIGQPGRKKAFRYNKTPEKSYLVKLMPKWKQEKSSESDDSSSEIDEYRAFDYEKESMKILKNTSSFAQKIMTGIRLAARCKRF